MPCFEQFPDEIDEERDRPIGAIGINFSFPTDVREDETPKEAVQRWIDEQSDEELAEFVRERTWEYWY
jgi:hypothetical protein